MHSMAKFFAALAAAAVLPCVLASAIGPQNRATGLTYVGHDISSLIMLETEQKVSYTNLAGTTQPLEVILAAGGSNTMRQRVWVNPVEGVYGLAYNLQLAKRVQAAGLKVYLDLHYSDTWADGNHQTKPAAWASLTTAQLVTQIGTYTTSVVQAFKTAGVRVDIISIGNEIRGGLLWPTGKTPNYSTIATLLKAASLGVKAVTTTSTWTTPLIGIHIDNGWDWSAQSNFYNSVISTGLFALTDFDIQFLSYYPFYSSSASLAALTSSTTQLANTYKKKIIIAETDWPVTCSSTTTYPFPSSLSSIPFSAAGQTTWAKDIVAVVKAIPNGLGQGLFYWEPGWLNNTGLGSECEDVLLFDQDWSGWPNSVVGRARSSVNMFV